MRRAGIVASGLVRFSTSTCPPLYSSSSLLRRSLTIGSASAPNPAKQFGLAPPQTAGVSGAPSGSSEGTVLVERQNASPDAKEALAAFVAEQAQQADHAGGSSSAPLLQESAGSAERSESPQLIENVEAAQPAQPNINSVHAWQKAGLPMPVIKRLLELYPECVAPTPAQIAFFLAINKGDVDIYLKDYMGRGKTFALVLAALSIVAKKTGKPGRVLMILPTPHLAQQVEGLVTSLGAGSPNSSVTTVTTDKESANLNARIVLGTPRALIELAGRKRNVDLGGRLRGITHVFVDEIDTQLGPLPDLRRMTAKQLRRHNSRVHPPPVAHALNSLFGIKDLGDGYSDFSARRNITSVFSSATFDNRTRRHIYGKGWVRNKGDRAVKRLIDLDFSLDATEKQVAMRDAMAAIADKAGAVSAQPAQQKPKHYAFTVSPEGRIAPLDTERPGSSSFLPPALDEDGNEVDLDTLPLTRKGKDKAAAKPRPGLPVTLLEGLAYLHATVPPPGGTYSLAVLPDGASITSASAELTALGLVVAPLVPEVLAGGIDVPDLESPHVMLITTRAAVPGLHLPHLHSIYLLNGLDVSKLSPKAKAAGGREGQSLVYSIITGRLGRFATELRDPSNPQRVVSIVQEDSYEEWALRHMFGDMYAKWKFPLAKWPGEIS